MYHVQSYMSRQFARCSDIQHFFFLHFKKYLLQWEVIKC